MIQRIQTIWLFLTLVFALLSMKFVSYIGLDSAGVTHFLNGTSNIFLVISTAAVAVSAFIALFLFKNRNLQFKIVLISIFLEFIVVGFYVKEIISLTGKGEFTVKGLVHLFILIFLILAAKAINADEKLVKDSNRLR